MCIAILNVKGTLPKQSILNSWANNYHGAGFAYSDGERINIVKEDKDADVFYKLYAKHRKMYPKAKFLIHFRISTHGTISKDNLHPFLINDDVALIHNGMVDFFDHKASDTRSDTRFLCEEFLAKMPKGWHLSEGVHKFISEVGGYSKFVMLDIDNNHAIINESAGHWDKNNWYSNTSYKAVNSYLDYGGKKVAKGSTTSYNNSWSSSFYDTVKDVENDSVWLKYDKILSVKDVLLKNNLTTIGRTIMSANIDFEYAEMLKNIDSVIKDDDDIKENCWYHLPSSKKDKASHFEICWVTVSGNRYSVVAKNGFDGYETMLCIPFAIRNSELLTEYLTSLDKDSSLTKTDKLIDCLDSCYHLVIDAEDVLNSFTENAFPF